MQARTVFLVWALAGAALAQEAAEAKPESPKKAADRVVVIVRVGDEAGLKALAERDDPDPWLVADDLCVRGQHAAAVAFAKAAPRRDVEKLPAYVASRGGKVANSAVREALFLAGEAFDRKDPQAVLAALDAVAGSVPDLVSVVLLQYRGEALDLLQRPKESAAAHLSAAQAAEGLGWLARAVTILNGVGHRAYYARADFPAALQAWERCLVLEESRGNRRGAAAALGNIGLVHESLLNDEQALKFQMRALELLEGIPDRFGMAVTLGGIGVIHINLGKYKEALQFEERALGLMQELENRHGEAAILGDIALIHERLEESAKALAYQQRALELLIQLDNRKGVARTLGSIGRNHRILGDHAQALKTQKRALPLMEELGDRAGMARTLEEIGVSHDYLGDYSDAIASEKLALELYEEVGDRADVARTLGYIGLALDHIGMYAEALEFQKRALTEYEALEDRAGVAKTLGNLGKVQWNLGVYEEALEYQVRSLKMNEELKDHAGVATTLGLIGSIHRSMGAHAKALEYQERALKLNRELNDLDGVAATLGNIGNIHVELGGFKRSLEFQQEALGMSRERGDRAGMAATLGNIGNIHAELGNHEEALKSQMLALEMSEELKDKAGIAATLGNIGSIHAKLGNNEKARTFLERSLKRNEELGSKAYLVANLEALGDIHEALQEYEEAREVYTKALATSREIGSPRTPVLATSLGALLLDHFDKPDEAVPLLEDAIDRIEARRTVDRGLSDEQRASYARTLGRGRSYAAMVRAQLALSRPLDALRYAERGRARAVLDMLANSKLDPFREAERRADERGDKERLARITTVRTDLEMAERKIRHLTHAAAARRALKNVKRSELQALAKELRAARAAREVLLGQRARLIRETLDVGAPATSAAIRAGLREKERMLFYSVGKKGCLLFAIPPTGSDVSAHALRWPDGKPVTEATLSKAIAEYRAWISGPGRRDRGFNKKVPKGGRFHGKALFEALIPPELRTELQALSRIYLVPDGVLYRLPFETLLVADDTYWIDRFPPTTYGQSGSVLLWCKERRDAQRVVTQEFAVVALGNPVFSRAETEQVQPPEEGALVVLASGELEAGDVVVGYDGRAISDWKGLKNETRRVVDEIDAETRKTEPVEVKLWRAGADRVVTVEPGSFPARIDKNSPRDGWSKLCGDAAVIRQRNERLGQSGALSELPGTKKETEAIRAALKGAPVETLLGERATKSRLFELAPKARFVHIATHGLVDETEFRGYSRLALTLPRIATPKDDGFLSMYELFEDWRDRLSACELVVLSACETGTGPLQKDEGPYALPLGFLYAGAPAVIGSLWRVDDASTAELFADFYKRVADGTPNLKAFTEARQALRKKHSQPYFWAPFVYIGDPR